jgi:nickel-dependent lactate racemase
MVKGAELSSKYSQTKVNKKFDLVIASAGGYPKDINFYQSQKAITNALELSASGGTIILVAACEEGHGSEAFFSYICGFKDPRAILVKFPLEPFIVGPHKALLLARQLIDHKVYLHSSLKGEVVKNMLMEPIELNDIHALLHGLPKSSTIAVIPDAVHTIPYVVET